LVHTSIVATDLPDLRRSARGVLGLLRKTPGGPTFQASPSYVGRPIHRSRGGSGFFGLSVPGPLFENPGIEFSSGGAGISDPYDAHSRPSDARRVHRDLAAWTAGRGKLRRISDAPNPTTAPRPASEDAVQTPLALGRDGREYRPRCEIESIVLGIFY